MLPDLELLFLFILSSHTLFGHYLYAALGFRHLRQSNEYVNQVSAFNKAYLVMKKENVQTTQTACNVTSSNNSATQKEREKRKLGVSA